MPFILNMRTLTGPPSWNRSEKYDLAPRFHSSPVRAANETVCSVLHQREGGILEAGRFTYQAWEQRARELAMCLRLVEGSITTEPGELLEELGVRATSAEQSVVPSVTRPRVEQGRLDRLTRRFAHATE